MSRKSIEFDNLLILILLVVLFIIIMVVFLKRIAGNVLS